MESRIYDLDKIIKDKDDDHAKAMVEVVEDNTTNYKKLEKEHHDIINKMKDAEEKARAKAELRSKSEVEVAKLKEKVRLLEAQCVKSIGLAREEGIKEGKQAGQQELLDQVRTDFQGVFNRGFWDGWKLALKKAKVPHFSRWFLREKTPLPYPEARLRASDAEEEDEEEDEYDDGEAEVVGGEHDNAPGSSASVPEDTSDLPASVPKDTSDPSISVPEDVPGSSTLSSPALVDPAPPTET